MTRRALAVAVLILSAQSALAQVGHQPSSSPYRTLRYGQFMGLTVGYFDGDGGAIGVAPHQGEVVGLRYEFLASGTLTLGISASYGHLQRYIVDAYQPIATTGRTGPFDQSVVFTEGILQFNFAGGKSWHRIAPFVSGGVGLAIASELPADTSGFKFRTKATLTPGIGARIFLKDRLVLRVEARTNFWQLSYPDVYRRPPADDRTQLPAITGGPKEWETSGWYQIGLSYAFHRPF
jgi:opacity protein-like surface antigen